MLDFLNTLAKLLIASMVVIFIASFWVDYQHNQPAPTPIDYPTQDN